MVWRLLDFQSCNIFENMAIDEAVFDETIKNHKPPTIRFYTSNPFAITIGYFQDAHKELNIEKYWREGIDVTRRITGGRAVFHFHEITYSVAAAEHEKIFPADILGAYKIISQCIARGLRELGIHASLAEDGRPFRKDEIQPCCFSTSLRNELQVKGRKICGSAQVRKKGGFLQHGLLLLDFDAEKTADLMLPDCTPLQVEELEKSVTSVAHELGCPMDARDICSRIKKGFIKELGIKLEDGTLTSAEEKLKDKLMKKYTDVNWNIERKKYFKAA
ncbi:MAG: lipoate--protein ligase family protein [Smithella sp.]|nr:lipoate--protein ligase family protein [Smithella sp.]